MKTTAASYRAMLLKNKVYLPNHRKNYTSIHYMKKLSSGDIKYYLLDKVNWVTVPLYDEF